RPSVPDLPRRRGVHHTRAEDAERRARRSNGADRRASTIPTTRNDARTRSAVDSECVVQPRQTSRPEFDALLPQERGITDTVEERRRVARGAAAKRLCW